MAKKTKSKTPAIEDPKVGRPKIDIDEAMVEKMAKELMPKVKIAHLLGISVDTLDRYFAEKIEVWQSDTDRKIAQVFLHESLIARKDWALKMLVQGRLGYSDKIKTETDLKHSFDNLTDEELDASINEKIKKLKGGV